MPLNALRPAAAGSHKKKKLLGRGPGSGHGKTSTRGHKGQKARSGRDFYLGFEGGQSPLARRIPKRGFFHHSKREYQLLNIRALNGFDKDTVIEPKVMQEKGLIRESAALVKVLGDGDLTKPLTIKAHKFSASAIEKIEKAGGKAEVIKDRLTEVKQS